MTNQDSFVDRHIGPNAEQRQAMLKALGFQRMEDLIDHTVPKRIRTQKPLALNPPRTEFEAIADLRKLVSENQVFKSYMGMGYSDCITPPVIQRNVLENPGWYTQYTPYQAEIAQGRLEALLNFQTRREWMDT